MGNEANFCSTFCVSAEALQLEKIELYEIAVLHQKLKDVSSRSLLPLVSLRFEYFAGGCTFVLNYRCEQTICTNLR